MGKLMIAMGDAVPEALRQALTDLLRLRLDGTGVDDIAIYPDTDHDGDPVVIVRVNHHLVDRPIEFRQVFDASTAARDLAWEHGERRFVHINHNWHDDQKVAGER